MAPLKGSTSWNKGKKASEETRRKLSESHRGISLSDDTRIKISQSLLGKKRGPLTEEHRLKLSLAHKGKRASEETRNKLSTIRKGHKVSEETRRKISLANNGKTITDETRKRLSLSHRGIKYPNRRYSSEQGFQKGHKLNLGRHFPEEFGRKIVETRRKGDNYRKTDESIKMQSESLKRRYLLQPELKIRMSEVARKALSSLEVRKRMSESHKGKKLSEDQKNKMSISAKLSINRGRFKVGHIESQESSRKRSLSMKGKNTYKRSEETKRKLRISFNRPEYIKMLKERRARIIFPLKDSKIEVRVQNFLKQLNIPFLTHQYMRIEHAYQCDLFIPAMNLIIECDGDFVHSNPLKYPENYIRYPKSNKIKIAKEVWALDGIRTIELKQKGYNVLRLWGSEIEKMDLKAFSDKLAQFKNS